MKSVAWRLRSRVGLAVMFAAIVAVVGAAGQQEGRQGGAAPAGGGRGNFANNFTGTIAVQQTTGMNMSRIRFEAGARTNWHLHSSGQLLLIEEGRGRLQEQGDPVKELAAGQPVYTRANVLHWHGAAPDQAALQFSVYSGTLEWKQAVTDDEYAGRAR